MATKNLCLPMQSQEEDVHSIYRTKKCAIFDHQKSLWTSRWEFREFSLCVFVCDGWMGDVHCTLVQSKNSFFVAQVARRLKEVDHSSQSDRRTSTAIFIWQVGFWASRDTERKGTLRTVKFTIPRSAPWALLDRTMSGWPWEALGGRADT